MNELRLGIIGFDTSHVPDFTQLLNDPADPFHVPGGKVVAGFPSSSPDLKASSSRVQGFTRDMTEKYGVRLADSIEELVEEVDAVLLASVDGRRHLAEARPVIAARKPLFINKPLAADYHDAAELVRLAEEHRCPLFSASALRFDINITALKEDAALGQVLACDAFTPATLEPTNPGLLWYGIHGLELLYAFMGRGCRSVRCLHSDAYDVVIGTWPEGRLATLRGTRCGASDFGVTVFGEAKIAHATYSREMPLYAPLLTQIMAFFQGAPPPVALEETLEMMAFARAALISGQENREVEVAMSE